jgi:coenzyme F420-0:L-glutamate ligase/coenzyme F420-1:gamma-L-glutamate ligase
LKTYIAIALTDFPFIKTKDNIPKIIVKTAKKNNVKFEDGDIIVISQKIFSKAENRIVNLKSISPSEKAKKIAKITDKTPKFVELVLRETRKIIKSTRKTLLVEDKRGLICINAGIDKSNVEGESNFALLPINPNNSAKECRKLIKKITGKNVAIIICDTYSRPFRRGQVNFAIGLAGIKPFKDYRGKKDLFNYILKVKNTAVVDEIAAAAELLIGQATEATPVVIFKGLKNLVELSEEGKIDELFISKDEDLYKNSL